MRGQLWDAFLQTAAVGMDVLASYNDEYNGAVFTVHTIAWHSQFYSSLLLITQVDAVASGNVAY